MKDQFKRLGAFILKGFAVNLNRFNQHVQRLIFSTGTEFTSEQRRSWQSSRSMASVADDAPVLIWVADTQAKCTYFNQTWLRFTGRSLEQELGNGWTEGVHPDDLQHCMNTFLVAFQARRPFSMEYRLQQANGEYRWVLDNGIPQFQDNQEFAGYIGTCVDITPRKQAEVQQQQLLKLLSDLKFALDQAAIVAITDANGSIIDVNDRFCEISQYSREELLGQTHRLINSHTHPEPFFAELWQTIARGQVWKGEIKNRTKDGSEYWVDTVIVPFLNELGEPYQYMSIRFDVTTHKQAEAALRQSQARLAEAQRLAQLGNWEFSLQSQEIIWSDELFRMFGRDPHEPEPSYADYLQFCIHPEDRAELQHCVERSLATGKDYTLTYRAMQPDGSIRYHEGRGNVEYDAQGQAIRLFGTAQDITTAKLAEQQLKDSEAFLDSIINAIADPIFVKNEQHQWVLGNAAFCNLVGASNAEFASKTDYDFFPPEQAQVFWQNDEAVLTAGLENISEEVANHARRGLRTFVTQKTRFQDSAGHRFIVGYSRDVTEQKQAEAEIRESQQQLAASAAKIRQSEEQLRLTLEFTGIGAWSWHPVTGDYAWDGRMEALLELPLGMANMFEVWCDRIHPDDREQVTTSIQHALATRTAFSEEYRYCLQNGQITWRWVRGQGIYSETGKIVRVLGVLQDINDRKYVEVALRQSEAQYRRIVETANEGIWIIDSDSKTSFVNPKMATMLGYTADEMLGKSMFEFMAESEAEYANQKVEQRQQGVAEQHDFKFQHQDGTDVWVLISSNPIMDETGQYIGALGMITDISDRKRAEFALQEKQQQLNSILNNIPHIAWLKDRDGRFLAVNQPFAQACGFPLSELAGLTDFDLWPPHLAEAYTQDDREVMASRQPKRVEEPLFTAEGAEKWIETIKTPILNDQGESIGTAGIAMDITERKQTELALQQLNEELERRVQQRTQELARSEQDLRTIFNNVYDAIFIYDMDGVILDCNARSLELFAATRAQLLNTNVTHLAAEVKQPEVIEDAMQRVEAGEILQFECRAHRLSDAAILEVEVSLRQVILANRPVIIAGVRDIRDRKQAERALRDSEERLRLAMTAANQGLYDLNVQTGEALVSPEYATMLGYDPATFQETNTKWIDRLHPDDLEPVALTYRAYLAGEIPHYKVEFRQRTQDGQWKWILSLGKTVAWDETGQPLRMLGTHTDIDERKRAEAQLREQEQFLRSIYEGVRQPIFVADVLPDHQLQVVGWNSTAAQLAGKTTEEVAGKLIEDIFDAEAAAEILSRYVHCIQARHPVTFEERITFHQETRWLLTTYNPLMDSEGNVYRVVGTVYDITARKQAEDALQQLNLELEQRVSDRTRELQQAMEAAEAANQAKSTFLANMSHELRTPLNAILGFAQLMSRDSTLDAEKREQLSIINRSGKHLLSLINDILEMSKIEAGRTIFTPNQFNLQTQIDTLAAMFQLRAAEKGLQFIIERDPLLPHHIETDENKLRQVLINLLGNAIKFTRRGYIRLRIQVQEADTSSALVLQFEVEDTGIGIDAFEVDSLFEPFIQSNNRQLAQEGTGLGLPISRQFVQLLGGELTVQTTLGLGSTFAFAIPVNRVEVADGNGAVARPIIGLAPTQSTFRILVVEDNDTNRMLLVQLLQLIGFEVQSARDGQQAIAVWETWHPHLIWMDMRMPVMDGYKATSKIRAREQRSSAPPTVIIALTANVFEEERVRVLQVGCNDFVRKPFQDTELLEKIALHLGVEYLYAEPEPQGGERAVPAFDAIATLQLLPPALLTQLKQATMELDKLKLTTLLDQIAPEYPELVALLQQQMENFAFEEILHLVERAIQAN